MHEYPITRQIIKIAEKHAAERGAARVARITVVVGDLCGYVPDTVKLYFDEISKGTMCEGGELVLKRIKPKLRCTGCGELFERKLFSFACPECGGEGVPSGIGSEFYVESVEIESDETDCG